MESSEHNWTNISETICPTMLVFGKKASWMFFFQTILMNPIISQIQFFMTSHFSTLFRAFLAFCRALKNILELRRIWKRVQCISSHLGGSEENTVFYLLK